MTAELERYLWDRVPTADRCSEPFVRDTIAGMRAEGLIRNEKQAWATLEKWCREGCYEFGVALNLGWRDLGGKSPRRLGAV